MNNQTSENKDEKLTGKTPDSEENETPKAEPSRETAAPDSKPDKPSEAPEEKTKPAEKEPAAIKPETTPEAPAKPSFSFPELLTVSPSPHVRTEDTTRSIMVDVCIALAPALIWGIFAFGLRALTITLISVIFSVLSEFTYEKLMKKRILV